MPFLSNNVYISVKQEAERFNPVLSEISCTSLWILDFYFFKKFLKLAQIKSFRQNAVNDFRYWQGQMHCFEPIPVIYITHNICAESNRVDPSYTSLDFMNFIFADGTEETQLDIKRAACCRSLWNADTAILTSELISNIKYILKTSELN